LFLNVLDDVTADNKMNHLLKNGSASAAAQVSVARRLVFLKLLLGETKRARLCPTHDAPKNLSRSNKEAMGGKTLRQSMFAARP
jgi:hypothetical protein